MLKESKYALNYCEQIFLLITFAGLPAVKTLASSNFPLTTGLAAIKYPSGA